MKDRIARIRKEANISQGEMADMLGLTRNYISLIECGNRVPSDRTISDICREFHVNEKWLRTGEGDMIEPLERNAQITRFVGDALKGADPSVKRRFVTVLSQATTDELEAIEKFALRLAAEYQRENKEGG